MANTEFRTIISVSTGESVTNIKELKENISFLKKSLEGVDLASEEYQKTLKELDINQRALKDATKTNAKSFTELEQKTNGMGHSYDALRNRLASLTKEWHSVDKALEPKKWEELAIEINNTRNSLKDMDASVGNFQRNVGDYENKMVSAWSQIKQGVSSAIPAVNGVTASMQTLSKVPIVFLLTAIAKVIQEVIKGFQSSEENVFALKKAMSAFTPIADAVTNTMQFLAKGIVKVVDGVGKLARKLKLVKAEAVAEREDIAKREIELTKKEREARVLDAKAMRDVSELRNKAIQVQYKDRELQKKYLEEANALEKQMMDRKLAIAQEQYDIAKIKAEWTGNDAETNEALADSEAHLYEVQKEYSDRTRRINSQIATSDRAMNAEKKKQSKDVTEEILANTDKVVEKDADALQKRLDNQSRFLELFDVGNTKEIDQSQRKVEAEIALDDRRFEHIMENNRKEREEAEALAQAKKDIAYASVDAMGQMFGILASIYESDEKNAGKNAGKIKALRIAEVTISTLQGAVEAYSQAQQLGPIAGPVVGGINAGLVTATGVANIAKIKSVNIAGGGDGGSAVPSPVISAPRSSISASPTIRTITGVSAEDRLNESIKDQRVILVASDIDEHSRRVEMIDNEANF